MSSFFENLLGTAAGYYNADEAAKAALELGERGAQELSRLGTEVAACTIDTPRIHSAAKRIDD